MKPPSHINNKMNAITMNGPNLICPPELLISTGMLGQVARYPNQPNAVVTTAQIGSLGSNSRYLASGIGVDGLGFILSTVGVYYS